MATRAIPRALFSSSAKRWFELTRTLIESEDDGDALEQVDRLLLGHKPASDLEVVVLMDVIAETLRSGGRIDGLDVAAVLNVRDRILNTSTERGLLDEYSALQHKGQGRVVEQRYSLSG